VTWHLAIDAVFSCVAYHRAASGLGRKKTQTYT